MRITRAAVLVALGCAAAAAADPAKVALRTLVWPEKDRCLTLLMSDEGRTADGMVRYRVRLLRGRVLVQEMTVESRAQGDLLSQHGIETDDVDFDGHPDLAILVEAGAKWGRHLHYRYDADLGTFVQDGLTLLLDDVAAGNGPYADGKRGEIVVPYLHLVGPVEDRYTVACGALELVSHADACDAPGGTLYVRWRRVGGQWRVVAATGDRDALAE